MAITALTGQFYMITVAYCEEFPKNPEKFWPAGVALAGFAVEPIWPARSYY